MSDENTFDIIIIGGGATGLGVAVDAISRGYKVLLLEAYDFGKGTSSKSTKLVHGGIRYLANLDFALVKEGLHERYYFLKNAPHLAQAQTYLVPFYSLWDKLKYYVGIKLYDFLSGKLKIGESKFLSREETLLSINTPDLQQKNLIGSAVYYDGQFDDTRLLISLLRTYLELGGVAYNYHQVTQILKDNLGKANGVSVLNTLNSATHKFMAKVIINATGTLTDSILDIDEPEQKHNHVTAAQGTHLVFNKEIFDSPHALVIPKTIDDRILFVLPWHNKIIVGTTDIAVEAAEIDPQPSVSEVDFILDTLRQYTKNKVYNSDIKAKFAGLRPLVKPKHNTNSAKISRKHEILMSNSNLISIVGGKWTIYRLMALDTIDFIIKHKLLENKGKSKTQELKLFGYTQEKREYPLSVYGTDYIKILQIQKETNNFAKLHPDLPYYQAEVIYHIRYEMAQTIEDILARRTRALFLDAKSAFECANLTALLMAQELDKPHAWVENQLRDFYLICKVYLP